MDNGDSDNQREERNIFQRITCCILWFIPFYYVTMAIIKGVVAGIAGFHANTTFQEGETIGPPAVQAFYDENGFFVVAFQVMAYAALCLLRWVPGVGKYKRMKRQ
jgi:hypothetical protein